VKIKEDDLAKIYEFDKAMMDSIDTLQSAIDNIETSIGTDGLPAAIRHLTNLAQDLVETFNKRSSVIMMESGDSQ